MAESRAPSVLIERTGAVLVATIDHPPVNAISMAVIAGLEGALTQAEADAGCHALMVTGSGSKYFSAGADLGEIGAQGEELRAGGLRLLAALEASPLPVVVAVNGMALGGGCELALGADLRIASRSAQFAQPEIKLGLIPGWGGTQRLGRLVGRSAALGMLLTGEPVDAEAALRLGLVGQVVEPQDLGETAFRMAASVAARAPLAVAAVKRSVREGLDLPLAQGLTVEARELRSVLTSGDATEGVMAFLAKRPPRWTGC